MYMICWLRWRWSQSMHMSLGTFVVARYMILQPVSSRGKIVKCSQIKCQKYMETVLFQKFAPLNSGYWIPKYMETCCWRWYLEQRLYGISWFPGCRCGRTMETAGGSCDRWAETEPWLTRWKGDDIKTCRCVVLNVLKSLCHDVTSWQFAVAAVQHSFRICLILSYMHGNSAQHSASCHSMSFLTHLSSLPTEDLRTNQTQRLKRIGNKMW